MDRQDRQNLTVAVVAVVLILGAWWLMSELTRRSRLEECLMRRQRNCEQIMTR